LTSRVVDGRRNLGYFLGHLQDVRAKVWRERQEIIRKWGLARRVARKIRLIRTDSKELYIYNDAIEILDRWIGETASQFSLVALVHSNVTKLTSYLGDLATNKFSGEIRAQLGNEGLLELHAHIIGMEFKARGLQKTIDNARVIEREKVIEESASNPNL